MEAEVAFHLASQDRTNNDLIATIGRRIHSERINRRRDLLSEVGMRQSLVDGDSPLGVKVEQA